MIESIAYRIALAIKRMEPNQTASVEVMKFSLEGILQTLLTLFFISIVGLLTGKIGETMIGALAFVILRFFSGGMHLRNALHCSLFSTIFIAIAPHIMLNTKSTIIMIIINIIIVSIFAPSKIEGHARIPKKYFPLLKVISILIVSFNFIFLNPTIAVVHCFQAISTITIKRR